MENNSVVASRVAHIDGAQEQRKSMQPRFSQFCEVTSSQR